MQDFSIATPQEPSGNHKPVDNINNSNDNNETKIAIVQAKFNERVTDALFNGAYQTLIKNGVLESSIESYIVPGAFEIPVVCERIFKAEKADAIIAIGAVIKGETAHFEYVAGPTVSGLMTTSLKYAKPIIMGVLTTNNVEEALNRAGLKYGNKGSEAALTLLEVLGLFQEKSI